MNSDALRDAFDDLIFEINDLLNEADNGQPVLSGYWLGVRRVAKAVEDKIARLSDQGIHLNRTLRSVDDWFANNKAS